MDLPSKPKPSHTMVDNIVAMSRENLDKVGIEDGEFFSDTGKLYISKFQMSKSKFTFVSIKRKGTLFLTQVFHEAVT